MLKHAFMLHRGRLPSDVLIHLPCAMPFPDSDPDSSQGLHCRIPGEQHGSVPCRIVLCHRDQLKPRPVRHRSVTAEPGLHGGECILHARRASALRALRKNRCARLADRAGMRGKADPRDSAVTVQCKPDFDTAATAWRPSLPAPTKIRVQWIADKRDCCGKNFGRVEAVCAQASASSSCVSARSSSSRRSATVSTSALLAALTNG